MRRLILVIASIYYAGCGVTAEYCIVTPFGFGFSGQSPSPMEAALRSWLAVIVLSPIVGSFLGVLIRRLPADRPVIMARSACESCGRPLAPHDLLPLVSYVVLHGRCRTCGTPIAPFHLAIELAALGVGVMALMMDAGSVRVWADCVLGWTLLALAWIDWQHFRLPDVLTWPLLLAGLVVTWGLQPAELINHAAGAALGYFAFRAIALVYRGMRGREGLGQGDAKLLAVVGAWLGVAALPVVVLGASLVGLGAAALLAWRGARLDGGTALPFGPCLALAFWLVWLLGTPPYWPSFTSG